MTLKQKIHEIIFGYETRAGRAFDVALILAISISVVAVMLDSVASITAHYGTILKITEWVLTILFTLEYFLRIYCVQKPRRYIFSFFGIVDLLAILPSYLSLFVPSTQYLLTIRVLRVLRVFRILKLVQFMGEASVLGTAIRASRHKIAVFLTVVLANVTIVGSIMYLIEGPASGFTSIPISIYWAIVTITTVGYGDIAPHTPLGQGLSSVLMIMGYGIIAVPTGIVTVELNRASLAKKSNLLCPECRRAGHDADASFCKFCGNSL